MKTLNPGSQEAIDAGCICPVVDNNYGKGIDNGTFFWYESNCPVHTFTDEKGGK